MKDIFEPTILNEVLQRVEKLEQNTQKQWGKMEVAQMFAHCSNVLELAVGDKTLPRSFIGRIFGRFVKPMVTNDKPYKHNSPTDPNFIVRDHRDFAREKERLVNLLTRFSQGGQDKTPKHPHPFFGKMTPQEWSSSQYKHLDHHLQQFGV